MMFGIVSGDGLLESCKIKNIKIKKEAKLCHVKSKLLATVLVHKKCKFAFANKKLVLQSFAFALHVPYEVLVESV